MYRITFMIVLLCALVSVDSTRLFVETWQMYKAESAVKEHDISVKKQTPETPPQAVSSSSESASSPDERLNVLNIGRQPAYCGYRWYEGFGVTARITDTFVALTPDSRGAKNPACDGGFWTTSVKNGIGIYCVTVPASKVPVSEAPAQVVITHGLDAFRSLCPPGTRP